MQGDTICGNHANKENIQNMNIKYAVILFGKQLQHLAYVKTITQKACGLNNFKQIYIVA